MTLGEMAVPILLAAVIAYSGSRIVRALRSGRVTSFGGSSYERARHSGPFWQAVAVEGAISLLLVFLLVRNLL